MFVRFRQTRTKLQMSLIETRRVEGKVRHEHIASLGSIAAEPSVADRIGYWSRLHERLAKLSNRLGPDHQAKVMGEVHARVPMVTPDEQRALQLENAKTDVNGWSYLHAVADTRAERDEKLVAVFSDNMARQKEAAAIAETEKKAAQARVEAIDRGESVGGFGKPMDRAAILKAAGITEADARHYELIAAAISDEHLKEFSKICWDLQEKGEQRRQLKAIRQIIAKYGWPDDGKS
jgi:hypothetical protein